MTGSKGSQVLATEEIEKGSERWTRTPSGLTDASPDGRWLAIYGSFTPTLYIHRLPGMKRVAKLTHPANIRDFEFSPLSDEVAICSPRAGVEFWSTATWKRTRALTNFTGILYAPDVRSFWLTKDSRTAGLYDAQTLTSQCLLPMGMLPLAVTQDGRHLAVRVNAQRLQVWDLMEVRRQLRELGLDWDENLPELKSGNVSR
jgi:hypothetical protein